MTAAAANEPVRVAAGGHAVSVVGDERARAWVEFYLAPWWPADPEARAAGRIDARAESLHGRGEASAVAEELVPTFYGVVGRRWDGNDVCVVVQERGLAYRHDRAGHVEIFGEDPAWLQYATALVTRQLVRGRLESDGWVQVHAACVDGPQGGTVIVGPSGSGKTTSALQLSMRGYALLGNDRCFLRAADGTVEAIPWPMPISIGLGLLAAAGWGPGVIDSVRRGDRQHHFQPDRVTDALREGRLEPLYDESGHEDKYEAYPTNLAAWFGVRLATSATVRRVLRPRPEDRTRVDGAWQFDPPDVFSGRDNRSYPNFLELPGASPEFLAESVHEVNAALAALPQVDFAWRAADSFWDRSSPLRATSAAGRE